MPKSWHTKSSKPQPFLILLNVFSKSKFVFITNFYRIKLEYPKF
ncbi:hypothetical protein LEP1GSC088_0761 [Leptospira interrogans str. L1207]|nr:hypothetical protein LEP1GSC088_0761 [Leptospira interrogans str. L1207]